MLLNEPTDAQIRERALEMALQVTYLNDEGKIQPLDSDRLLPAAAKFAEFIAGRVV